MKNWLDSCLPHTSWDLKSRVEEEVSRVTYTLFPWEFAGTSEQFLFDVITALDEHNAFEVIKEINSCKQMVKKLVSKVEPPELKQLVREHMCMLTAEQKRNLTFFANALSTLAG